MAHVLQLAPPGVEPGITEVAPVMLRSPGLWALSVSLSHLRQRVNHPAHLGTERRIQWFRPESNGVCHGLMHQPAF